MGLWREPVREYGVEAAARLVREAGLAVTTLCRGGFFTSDDWPASNRAAVDEAAALGTDTLVLVSGGLTPAFPDLPAARARIAEAIGELAPYAAEHGVRLAVEPLHPMYAADGCAVSTLDQALEIAERFPPSQVGVVVDTYHLWWDDRAPAAVERAAATGRIHSFQLADWTTPPGRRPQRPRPTGHGHDRPPRLDDPPGGGRLHGPGGGGTLQRRTVGAGRRGGPGGDAGTLRGDLRTSESGQPSATGR